MSHSRVAVVGDIGGRLDMLQQVLAQLGIRDGVAPPDLTIVQVGDLIRVGDENGSDSLGCLRCVDQLITRNPRQWVQLVGNHEAALLGGPRRPTWPLADFDDDATVDIVGRWWAEGRFRMAHTVLGSNGPVLITHGGLTLQKWLSIGAPPTAIEAAQSLNDEMRLPPKELFAAGALIRPPGQVSKEDFQSEAVVDVVWPEVNTELYGPWLHLGTMPFDQVHGHAAPWNWSEGDWWTDASTLLRDIVWVDTVKRRVTLELPDGHRFTSVDWGIRYGETFGGWPVLEFPTPSLER